MSVSQDRAALVEKQAEGYLDSMQMHVELDQGLHRHLIFKKPDTMMGHFFLATWPGYLTFGGDWEAYTFRRENDMLRFFAGSRPNPDYWSEKLVSKRNAAEEHDADLARESATQYIEECHPEHLDTWREWCEDATDGDGRGFADEIVRTFEVRGNRVFDEWYEFTGRTLEWHFLRACHFIQFGANCYLRSGGAR